MRKYLFILVIIFIFFLSGCFGKNEETNVLNADLSAMLDQMYDDYNNKDVGAYMSHFKFDNPEEEREFRIDAVNEALYLDIVTEPFGIELEEEKKDEVVAVISEQNIDKSENRRMYASNISEVRYHFVKEDDNWKVIGREVLSVEEIDIDLEEFSNEEEKE